jgi:hypothetical protein
MHITIKFVKSTMFSRMYVSMCVNQQSTNSTNHFRYQKFLCVTYITNSELS